MSFEAVARVDVPFLNGLSLKISSSGQTIVPNVTSTFPVSSSNVTAFPMSNSSLSSGLTTYPGSSNPTNSSLDSASYSSLSSLPMSSSHVVTTVVPSATSQPINGSFSTHLPSTSSTPVFVSPPSFNHTSVKCKLLVCFFSPIF